MKKNILLFIGILIVLLNYKTYPSFFREGYFAINDSFIGGNIIGDTTFIYGNNGYFIYSIDGGIQWNNSYSGGSESITKIIAFHTKIIVLQDNKIKYSEKINSNQWKDINLNKLLSSNSDFVVDLLNYNNSIILLTKKGDLYQINDINGNADLKYSFNTISTKSKLFILENNIYFNNNNVIYILNSEFNIIKEILLICNNCDDLKINKNNEEFILSTKSKIIILNYDFSIKKEFEFEKDILDVLFFDNKFVIYTKFNNNTKPFAKYQMLNDTLTEIEYNLNRNKVSSSDYLNINGIITNNKSNKIIMYGDFKLLINTQNNLDSAFQIFSYLPSKYSIKSYIGSQTFQMKENGYGGILDSYNRMFITKNYGATWNVSKSNINTLTLSDAIFKIQDDRILCFKYNADSGNNIVILDKLSETIKTFKSEYILPEVFGLGQIDSIYYLFQNNGTGKYSFGSITKFKFTEDSIYYFNDFGNRNNGLTKFDSLYIKNYKIINNDNIFLDCIKKETENTFSNKLYKITNNGKDITQVGNSNFNFKTIYFVDKNVFLALKERIIDSITSYLDIYKSIDAGLTWELKYTANDKDIIQNFNQTFYSVDNQINLIGDSYELFSFDLGESWTRKGVNSLTQFSKLELIDKNTKFVISTFGFSNFMMKSIPDDFISSVEEIEYNIEDLLTLSITNAYPNPTRDNINVSVLFDQRYNMEDAVISVLDYLGKPINVQFELNPKSNYQSEIIINTQYLSTGMYLLNVKLGNTNETINFGVVK